MPRRPNALRLHRNNGRLRVPLQESVRKVRLHPVSKVLHHPVSKVRHPVSKVRHPVSKVTPKRLDRGRLFEITGFKKSKGPARRATVASVAVRPPLLKLIRLC